jgi:hypothetical protein
MNLGFSHEVSANIAMMEGRYVEYLQAGGSADIAAAKDLFRADTAAGAFWFDAWTRAREAEAS